VWGRYDISGLEPPYRKPALGGERADCALPGLHQVCRSRQAEGVVLEALSHPRVAVIACAAEALQRGVPGLLVTAVLRAYFHRYGKSVAPRFARVALTASPPHTCYLRRTGESAPGSGRLDRRPVVGVMPPHLFPHAPRSVRATAGPPAIRVACPSGEAGVGHLPVHAPRRQSPPVEYARAFAVRPCCSARPSSPGLCGTTFLLDVIVRPLRGQSPPLEHLVLTAPLWHA
jgi:hypothetical protein